MRANAQRDGRPAEYRWRAGTRLAGFQVASAEERKGGGEWAWLLLSTLGHGGECTAFVSDHGRVFVAVARPTLSVDRLLGYRSRRAKWHATVFFYFIVFFRPPIFRRPGRFSRNFATQRCMS